MFKLYATGQYSLGALAEEMSKRGLKTKRGKLLSPEQIKKILKNKFYIGKMVMWGKEVQGKHKPIIDESIFNQVQNILAERKITQDKWQKRDFLLRGLVYCQSCKRHLTAEVHPRGEYYRCQNGINSKCSEPYIYEGSSAAFLSAKIQGKIILSSSSAAFNINVSQLSYSSPVTVFFNDSRMNDL